MAHRLNILRQLGLSLLVAVLVPAVSRAQAKPATQKPASPPTTQKPYVGPPAPQSIHFPILLIATGVQPSWSARIGMKGLQRLERAGYPPINLVPGDVTLGSAQMTWNYPAKDADTGADVVAHLVRGPCTLPGSDTKFTFHIELDHAQIGALQGCAQMAPDQFPEFKTKNLDDDDPEKQKIGPPPITNFKPPVAYAYLDSSGRAVLRRKGLSHIVAERGSQLSLSNDGTRLLFTRDDSGGDRSIMLFDATTGRTTELFRGAVQQAFWSPDDTHIAFLKSGGSGWNVWMAPAVAPDQPIELYTGNVVSLQGWSDAHTVVADDQTNFYWIGDDGKVLQTISTTDLYGPQFSWSISDRVRANPINPDLLLVSAAIPKTAAGVPTGPQTGAAGGFFLYEIRSERRVLLSPSDLYAKDAEWSRDGIQIFFTGRESNRAAMTYRIFWDGSEPKRYLAGTDFVVGQ
jgi:uncharacterized membrane protein